MICSQLGGKKMVEQFNSIHQKISTFFNVAFQYYGKEISLPSNQFFQIDQLCNEEQEREGKFDYCIQYGFPQSGGIYMNFSYLQKENACCITGIRIYAPAEEDDMAVVNYSSKSQGDGMEIKVQFGIDMNTKEHATIAEIVTNPNAILMLEMANDDLSKAEILGDCKMLVPIGSNRIPCTNSISKPYQKKLD